MYQSFVTVKTSIYHLKTLCIDAKSFLRTKDFSISNFAAAALTTTCMLCVKWQAELDRLQTCKHEFNLHGATRHSNLIEATDISRTKVLVHLCWFLKRVFVIEHPAISAYLEYKRIRILRQVDAVYTLLPVRGMTSVQNIYQRLWEWSEMNKNIVIFCKSYVKLQDVKNNMEIIKLICTSIIFISLFMF